MNIMKKLNRNEILEIVCRWYVFIFLNFYGIGKIMGGQFYRKGKLPPEVAQVTIDQATAYELAWSFMGYSFYYILFVGISQIIGAWLLMWNRTKLLGVMILFPIMVNIIVFDIIFLDVKDALVNATIYFLMLLYILYANKEKIINAFKILTRKDDNSMVERPSHLIKLSMVFLIMTIIFCVDQFFVNLVRFSYN